MDRGGTGVAFSKPMFAIGQTVESQEGWTPAQSAILGTVEIVNRLRATLVLVLIPSKEQSYWPLLQAKMQDHTRYDIDAINRTLLGFCQANGLRCLDLTPSFR
jgi:hypothetical protein